MRVYVCMYERSDDSKLIQHQPPHPPNQSINPFTSINPLTVADVPRLRRVDVARAVEQARGGHGHAPRDLAQQVDGAVRVRLEHARGHQVRAVPVGEEALPVVCVLLGVLGGEKRRGRSASCTSHAHDIVL